MRARKRVTWAALAAAGALIAGTAALAAPASAVTPFPSCPGTIATTSCSNIQTPGEAGYYGADDNHTHYRFNTTVITAAPGLIDLNGPGGCSPNRDGAAGCGAEGIELCDPNPGLFTGLSYAAQIGLWYGSIGANPPGYHVSYAAGHFDKAGTSNPDPCTQAGIVDPAALATSTLLTNFTINQGDQIYLGLWYANVGKHLHQVSFGACDITQGVCRQAYSTHSVSLSFWEFGTGAVAAGGVTVTGGAINLLNSPSSDYVTCYSCAHSVPIGSVSVDGFGLGGGLTEAQWVNTSNQAQLSPNNSLVPGGNTFSLFEGSTSV